jgi:hypothetical protein
MSNDGPMGLGVTDTLIRKHCDLKTNASGYLAQ